MSAILIDWSLVGAIYLVAVYWLCRGYWHGHRAWALKHCIISPSPPRKRAVMAGYKGEAFIAGFAALAAGTVVFFTDNVTLVGVIGRWWYWLLPVLGFVYFWIREHSRRTVQACRNAEPRDRDGYPRKYRQTYVRQVRAAYRSYDVYSLCLFGTGALIIMLLIAQFMYDGGEFAAEAQRIGSTFERARAFAETPGPGVLPYEQAMAEAEAGLSGIALASKLLQIQFNPMFIFAGTLILINILIRFSRLKGMFTGGAVNMTAIFTYGPLIFIGLIALLIYLNVYEVMLESALNDLRRCAPPPALGAWSLAQRHGEMVAELSNARNIFGFGRAIGGEGGGFAILIWGVQWALDKIAESKEDDEAQDEVPFPSARFRPDDARRTKKKAREAGVAA